MQSVKKLFYAVCLVFLLAVASNAAEHEVGAYPYFLQDEVSDVMYGDTFEVAVMCPMGLDTSWTPTLDTTHSGNFKLLEVQDDVRDEDVDEFWYPYPTTVRFIIKAGDEDMGPGFFDGGNADYRLRFSVPTKNAEDQPITMLEPETPTDGKLNGILVKTVAYEEAPAPEYGDILNNDAVIRVGEKYDLEFLMTPYFRDVNNSNIFGFDFEDPKIPTWKIDGFDVTLRRGTLIGNFHIIGTQQGSSHKVVNLAQWQNEEDYNNEPTPYDSQLYRPNVMVLPAMRFEFAIEELNLHKGDSATFSLFNDYAQPGLDVEIDVAEMTHSKIVRTTERDSTIVNLTVETLGDAKGQDTLHVRYYDRDCARWRVDSLTITTNGYTGENPPGPDIPAEEPSTPGGGGGGGGGAPTNPSRPVSYDVREVTVYEGEQAVVSFDVSLTSPTHHNANIAKLVQQSAGNGVWLAMIQGVHEGETKITFAKVAKGNYDVYPSINVKVLKKASDPGTDPKPPAPEPEPENPTSGGGGGCSAGFLGLLPIALLWFRKK